MNVNNMCSVQILNQGFLKFGLQHELPLPAYRCHLNARIKSCRGSTDRDDRTIGVMPYVNFDFSRDPSPFESNTNRKGSTGRPRLD
jgi:hypothetical protein